MSNEDQPIHLINPTDLKSGTVVRGFKNLSDFDILSNNLAKAIFRQADTSNPIHPEGVFCTHPLSKIIERDQRKSTKFHGNLRDLRVILTVADLSRIPNPENILEKHAVEFMIEGDMKPSGRGIIGVYSRLAKLYLRQRQENGFTTASVLLTSDSIGPKKVIDVRRRIMQAEEEINTEVWHQALMVVKAQCIPTLEIHP